MVSKSRISSSSLKRRNLSEKRKNIKVGGQEPGAFDLPAGRADGCFSFFICPGGSGASGASEVYFYFFSLFLQVIQD